MHKRAFKKHTTALYVVLELYSDSVRQILREAFFYKYEFYCNKKISKTRNTIHNLTKEQGSIYITKKEEKNNNKGPEYLGIKSPNYTETQLTRTCSWAIIITQLRIAKVHIPIMDEVHKDEFSLCLWYINNKGNIHIQVISHSTSISKYDIILYQSKQYQNKHILKLCGSTVFNIRKRLQTINKI